MTYNPDAPRPYKMAARSVALQFAGAGTPTPSACSILLPGRDLLDVREGLSTGRLTTQTHLIVFEKDAQLAVHILCELRRLGFRNVTLRNEHLEKCDLFGALAPGELVDFAFLDFCNQLTPGICHWLVSNEQYFTPDAVVAITLSTMARNNRLVKALHSPASWPLVERSLPEGRTMFTLMRGMRKYTQATIFGAYAALACRRRIEVLDCIEYADTSPMVMVRFRLGKKRRRTCRTTPELLAAMARCGHSYLDPGLAPPRSYAKKVAVTKRVRPWQLLHAHPDMKPGVKAAAVRRARDGKKPFFMSAAEWAACPLNQNSHRFADHG